MAETELDKGRIAFQTEGRLLQELGERLVASPEVALVELIKNSYDADASQCAVSVSQDGDTLLITDDGAGMTYEQFASRWMRIATSNKASIKRSVLFKRHLTGQKGIGRFAVRFLGKKLKLESVAFDPKRKFKTRLVADFDWAKLDAETNLDSAKIPYKVFRASTHSPTGTALSLQSLRVTPSFAKSNEFRTAVLKITSPLRALDGGRFRHLRSAVGKDPGFHVRLPSEEGGDGNDFDLAETVLKHAWARLQIDLTGDALKYSVHFHDEESPHRLSVKIPSIIGGGLRADIRYFPRRTGVFRGTEVNGQKAWAWVRDNHGVAVIDNGFRIKPYGMNDDDWLLVDADAAHNRRAWRSPISSKHFEIPAEIRMKSENPMLILPSNFQLVGGVFVESSALGASDDENLITSMDREGFLYNESFEQLVDVVRGGIEFLALQDRAWIQREDERRAKEAAKRTRADLKAAVKYIQESPTLTKADKSRLVEEYSGLALKLTEVEEYDREARRKVETMSALGVVAGFMTHEAARVVSSLKEALDELRRLVRRHPSITQQVKQIESSYRALQGQLEYTRTFIEATQRDQRAKFKASPQIMLVAERFGDFAKHRNIAIELEVDPTVEVPLMPIAVYSGVILNLYTNALKAIVASSSARGGSRILFRAYNDEKWHNVEVLDTGVGIPPELRKRIWDPLFTTTSRLNNPLGSGMGLGLTLVKQLVEQVGGRIELKNAPEGFSTCFHIQFPQK